MLSRAPPRFCIECNKTGTRWTGKCWAYHEGVKHEFDLHFEIPGACVFPSRLACMIRSPKRQRDSLL